VIRVTRQWSSSYRRSFSCGGPIDSGGSKPRRHGLFGAVVAVGALLTVLVPSMALAAFASATSVPLRAPYSGSHAYLHYGPENGTANYGCGRDPTTQKPFFNGTSGTLGFGGSVSGSNCGAPNGTQYQNEVGVDAAIPITVSASSVHIVAHVTLTASLDTSLNLGNCTLYKANYTECTQIALGGMSAGTYLVESWGSSGAYLEYSGSNTLAPPDQSLWNATWCQKHGHPCSSTPPLSNSTPSLSWSVVSDQLTFYLNASGLNTSHTFTLHVVIGAFGLVWIHKVLSQLRGGSGHVSFSASGRIVSISVA